MNHIANDSFLVMVIISESQLDEEEEVFVLLQLYTQSLFQMYACFLMNLRLSLCSFVRTYEKERLYSLPRFTCVAPNLPHSKKEKNHRGSKAIMLQFK